MYWVSVNTAWTSADAGVLEPGMPVEERDPPGLRHEEEPGLGDLGGLDETQDVTGRFDGQHPGEARVDLEAWLN